MKTVSIIAVVAVLFVVPSRSFALWFFEPVTKEKAKEMGMEVRSTADGLNQVEVELEFKTEGVLKNFTEDPWKNYGHVDLRIGKGDNPSLTASLREDRSKPGRVVVRFTANRAQLDEMALWVYVPRELGGDIYNLRVKDFIEPKKGR